VKFLSILVTLYGLFSKTNQAPICITSRLLNQLPDSFCLPHSNRSFTDWLLCAAPVSSQFSLSPLSLSITPAVFYSRLKSTFHQSRHGASNYGRHGLLDFLLDFTALCFNTVQGCMKFGADSARVLMFLPSRVLLHWTHIWLLIFVVLLMGRRSSKNPKHNRSAAMTVNDMADN